MFTCIGLGWALWESSVVVARKQKIALWLIKYMRFFFFSFKLEFSKPKIWQTALWSAAVKSHCKQWSAAPRHGFLRVLHALSQSHPRQLGVLTLSCDTPRDLDHFLTLHPFHYIFHILSGFILKTRYVRGKKKKHRREEKAMLIWSNAAV